MTLTVRSQNPTPLVVFPSQSVVCTPVTSGRSAPDAMALAATATAVLRAALADMGVACPDAEAEVIRSTGHFQVVLHVTPDIPWRTTQAAAVRVVARLRDLDADVRLGDASFEAIPAER